MAIRNVVTRGYGSGATIPFVVLRGYLSSVVISATISGTLSYTEAQPVAGGEKTIITFANDTWIAAGAAFNAQRQGIIDGVSSAQSELTGWNAEVRDKEVVGSVVRTSDTVVTITWSAAPAFDITVDETITVTIPAAALVTSTSAVVGTPTFSIVSDIISGNRVKNVVFSSASAGATFSAVQSRVEFSSAVKSISIVDGPDFLSRLQKEDGGFLLLEQGGHILKEQE